MSDADCTSIIGCVQGCGNDSACTTNCYTAAPSSAQTEFTNLYNCWDANCQGPCEL